MQRNTLESLKKLSTIQRFTRDEYICHEGQPGHEMYVILEGMVGIYFTNAIGTLMEISRIGSGDFFGEMAIFDSLPRSASCIALEDTICIAIGKHNLKPFLQNCSDIVEKILENMSLRIRTLDDQLHNFDRNASPYRHDASKFAVPEWYMRHQMEEPPQDQRYFHRYQQLCPMCGKELSAVSLRRNILTVQRIDADRRIRYESCDPLWHDVMTCPYCLYSNHHLSFFRVNAANREQILEVLQEQRDVVARLLPAYSSAFDRLVFAYLQTIHLHEQLSPKDYTLPGILWLRLYWLGKDANDSSFAKFCARQALKQLTAAIDGAQISEVTSKCSIALSLAHLLIYLGTPEQAKRYCDIAAKSTDKQLVQQSLALKAELP